MMRIVFSKEEIIMGVYMEEIYIFNLTEEEEDIDNLDGINLLERVIIKKTRILIGIGPLALEIII